MPINSKKKGNAFECEVANWFKAHGFPQARRNLSETQEGVGIDLVGTGSFKVQTKAYKKTPNVAQIFSEFKGLSTGDIPLLFMKIKGKGTFVATRLEDFERFV